MVFKDDPWLLRTRDNPAGRTLLLPARLIRNSSAYILFAVRRLQKLGRAWKILLHMPCIDLQKGVHQPAEKCATRWTESYHGECSHSSVYQTRCLQIPARSMIARGLACSRTTVSSQNGLTLRRGFRRVPCAISRCCLTVFLSLQCKWSSFA